jgi:hypothetical protein
VAQPVRISAELFRGHTYFYILYNIIAAQEKHLKKCNTCFPPQSRYVFYLVAPHVAIMIDTGGMGRVEEQTTSLGLGAVVGRMWVVVLCRGCGWGLQKSGFQNCIQPLERGGHLRSRTGLETQQALGADSESRHWEQMIATFI